MTNFETIDLNTVTATGGCASCGNPNHATGEGFLSRLAKAAGQVVRRPDQVMTGTPPRNPFGR